MHRIMKGPVKVGNMFGFYGVEVPEDRWVVVTDGEYANGGHGPSLASETAYRHERHAHDAAAVLEHCDGCEGPEPGCRCAYDNEYTPPWAACGASSR